MSTNSNAAEYDRVYANRLYDVASVYDHIIRIRQRYFAAFERGASALDHGFGNGVISAYLVREGFDVFGVESSASAVAVVRERAEALGLKPGQFRHIEPTLARMPFPDSTFAAIASNQVIYFLPTRAQIDATVEDFSGSCGLEGALPARSWRKTTTISPKCGVPPVPAQGVVKVAVRGRIERDFELYRFRDKEDVRSTFERAGFVVDDLGYFDFSLLDVDCAKHYIVLARKA